MLHCKNAISNNATVISKYNIKLHLCIYKKILIIIKIKEKAER